MFKIRSWSVPGKALTGVKQFHSEDKKDQKAVWGLKMS